MTRRYGVAVLAALALAVPAAAMTPGSAHAYPPSVPTTTDGGEVLSVVGGDPGDTASEDGDDDEAPAGTLPQTGSSLDLGALTAASGFLILVGLAAAAVRRRLPASTT